jgi:hypothetical protein
MTIEIFYNNSNTDVRLGDYVAVKGILWGKKIGRISYLHGKSPVNTGMEWPDSTHVGISISDHYVFGFPIFTGQKYISKRVSFIKRSDDNYGGIKAHDVLL